VRQLRTSDSVQSVANLLQPVAIIELVCVLLTLPTMPNVVLGLSLVSGGLASRAPRPPGITYLMTCSTAVHRCIQQTA